MSMENVYPDNYFVDRVMILLNTGRATRADICKNIGITKGYLSGVLSGKKNGPSDTVNKLLDKVYPANNRQSSDGEVAILGALNAEPAPPLHPDLPPVIQVMLEQLLKLDEEQRLTALDAIRAIQRGGHVDSPKLVTPSQSIHENLLGGGGGVNRG